MRFLLLFSLLPLAVWSQDRSLQITDMRQLDTVLQPADYQVLIINSGDTAVTRVHYTARFNQFVNVHTVYYYGQKVIIEADTDVRYIPGTKFYSRSHEVRELFVDQSAINKLTWLKVGENMRLRSNGYRTMPISLQINRVTYENPLQPVYFDSLFWGNGHFHRFEVFEGAESLFTRPLSDIVLVPSQHYIPIPGINYSQFRSYEALFYSSRLNNKLAFQIINNSLKASGFDIYHIQVDDRNVSIGFVQRSPVYLQLLNRESNAFDVQLLDTFQPNIIITRIMPGKEVWQFLADRQNSKVIAEIPGSVTKRTLRRISRTNNNYILFLELPAKGKTDTETSAQVQKLKDKYRSFLNKKRITNVQIEVIVGT